jgi:fatty-acid desaturase
MGWLLARRSHRRVTHGHRSPFGFADISDLTKDNVVMWQEQNYAKCAVIFGILIPAAIPWLFWNDALGGLMYGFIMRMAFIHQVELRLARCFLDLFKSDFWK